MGWFNKILVQENKTGNLVDITNLDEKHYESFLDAMTKLNAAYLIAKENQSKSKRSIDVQKIIAVFIAFGFTSFLIWGLYGVFGW